MYPQFNTHGTSPAYGRWSGFLGRRSRGLPPDGDFAMRISRLLIFQEWVQFLLYRRHAIRAKESRRIGQRIQHLQPSFLLDKFGETLELKLKSRHLLPCLLQLIIIRLDLLLGTLVFLVQNHIILFHNFSRTGQGVIHELQLIQILLTIYQLINSVLVAISPLLDADLLLFLDNVVGLAQLLPLILNLLFVLAVGLKDQLFLLFHDLLLLLQNLLDAGFYAALGLPDLIPLWFLRFLQDFFQILILIIELLNSEFVFHVLLFEHIDLILSLLGKDFTLGYFLD